MTRRPSIGSIPIFGAGYVNMEKKRDTDWSIPSKKNKEDSHHNEQNKQDHKEMSSLSYNANEKDVDNTTGKITEVNNDVSTEKKHVWEMLLGHQLFLRKALVMRI